MEVVLGMWKMEQGFVVKVRNWVVEQRLPLVDRRLIENAVIDSINVRTKPTYTRERAQI